VGRTTDQEAPVSDQHPAPQIHDEPELRLVDNADRERYELWRGEDFVGFEEYEVHPEDGSVELRNTIISERFGRQGYARTLVTMLLEGFRERGVAVRATCPYVQDFLHRFPHYQQLLAPGAGLPPAQAVKEKRRRRLSFRAH
jgi:predicted GNAT family acetyltransferase